MLNMQSEDVWDDWPHKSPMSKPLNPRVRLTMCKHLCGRRNHQHIIHWQQGKLTRTTVAALAVLLPLLLATHDCIHLNALPCCSVQLPCECFCCKQMQQRRQATLRTASSMCEAALVKPVAMYECIRKDRKTLDAFRRLKWEPADVTLCSQSECMMMKGQAKPALFEYNLHSQCFWVSSRTGVEKSLPCPCV